MLAVLEMQNRLLNDHQHKSLETSTSLFQDQSQDFVIEDNITVLSQTIMSIAI